MAERAEASIVSALLPDSGWPLTQLRADGLEKNKAAHNSDRVTLHASSVPWESLSYIDAHVKK